jgi:heme oxygenase
MHEETNVVNTETPADYRVNPIEDITDDIQAALNNPATSDWLKWALRSCLFRDPVDATYDVVVLKRLLKARLELMLQQACKEADLKEIGANDNC